MVLPGGDARPDGEHEGPLCHDSTTKWRFACTRRDHAHMYDVLTTAAMVDELREHMLDGRVQKLGMVDPLTVAAEIYANGRRRALVASADAENPRLYLASSLPSFDAAVVTPFSLQLRKYVRGGFVIDVAQPPLERVIELTIARRLPDAAKKRGAGPDEDD